MVAPVPEDARLERCKLHILHVLHILIYCIYCIFTPYMQYCKDILLQGGRPFPSDAMLERKSKILVWRAYPKFKRVELDYWGEPNVGFWRSPLL